MNKSHEQWGIVKVFYDEKDDIHTAVVEHIETGIVAYACGSFPTVVQDAFTECASKVETMDNLVVVAGLGTMLKEFVNTVKDAPDDILEAVNSHYWDFL